MSGSSAPIYGVRLLEVLREQLGLEIHLVMSSSVALTLHHEAPDWPLERVTALAHQVHDDRDLAAPIASGSFRTEAMVVAPCSMKTLAAVAHGLGESLLLRAADVHLKERRPLILVPRETPLHLGHLRNLVAASEIGATILPPMVAFYHKPQTIMDIVDHTVGKILDQLGLDHHLFRRWST